MYIHNYKKRHGNAAKLHLPSKIRLTLEIHGCFISKGVIVHYQSPECMDSICNFFDIYAYTEKLIDILLLCWDSRFSEIINHSSGERKYTR